VRPGIDITDSVRNHSVDLPRESQHGQAAGNHEAERSGRKITRIAVAYEAVRDGFWLARWLMAHGLEAHVIHPASVAVLREHRRAKTDRLDTDLLKRAFVGWQRGAPFSSGRIGREPCCGSSRQDLRRYSTQIWSRTGREDEHRW
jgi:transposase